MKITKIKKYNNQSCGSTIGAFLYHYGVQFDNYQHFYSFQMTEEGAYKLAETANIQIEMPAEKTI